MADQERIDVLAIMATRGDRRYPTDEFEGFTDQDVRRYVVDDLREVGGWAMPEGFELEYDDFVLQRYVPGEGWHELLATPSPAWVRSLVERPSPALRDELHVPRMQAVASPELWFGEDQRQARPRPPWWKFPSQEHRPLYEAVGALALVCVGVGYGIGFVVGWGLR